MPRIQLTDLPLNETLDAQALATVRGGLMLSTGLTNLANFEIQDLMSTYSQSNVQKKFDETAKGVIQSLRG